MTSSARAETIAERIESGPGRRQMHVPIKPAYSLGELLPRRQAGLAYQVPGEMGKSLAAAFERTFSLIERSYGGLAVLAHSKLLTPRWLRVMNHLVRRGLANTLVLSQPLEKGLPLFYFDIASSFQAHATDGGRPSPSRFSRGFSDDYDHALAKVVGECLERTVLLYFRVADMPRGSARSLRARGVPFVEPGRLAVFAPWQIERRPELAYDDDSIFSWTEATSLLSSERVLVPSQLVYWNYPVGHGDVPEPLLREQSTHGAGAFYSLEGAILSGLLECVQRDGFFCRWLLGAPPARIDPASIRNPRTTRLVELARQVGLEPMFFDITSELGIPNCLCALVRADGELPHASLGASCRLDGETAIFDALLEAASVHHIVGQSDERLRLPPGYEPFADPTFSTPKRVAFWANPEHAEHLAPFFGGETTSVERFCRGVSSGKTARASLSFVVEVLRRHGLDAFYVEAEHVALDELGYATVRVIVPDLVPMYCEDRNAPLGHPRLAAKRRVLRGDDPAAAGPTAWPPWPHPFP